MREYYYLVQLNESPYKLSLSDALHLGNIERLEIYTYIPDHIIIKTEEQDEWCPANDIYLGIPYPLAGAMERQLLKTLHSLKQQSALQKLYGFNKALKTDKYWGFPSLPTDTMQPSYISISYPSEHNFEHPGEDYTVCLSDLLVWTEDLERLAEHGNIQRRSEVQKDAADDDSQDYPPHLEALILAWRKYWKNADRHDRSTHPKKDTVKNWLIEQGLSDRTADAGATIITPDWKK
jgi:hypothetical protein